MSSLWKLKEKMNGRNWKAHFFKAVALLAPVFLIILSIISLAYSGEFDLSEMDTVEVVDLPGTNMKAGMFRYVRYNGDDEYKAGILVNGKTIYYADEPAPGGECNFGIHNNYFLMDCWNFGSASGHNRHMYLFKYGEDAVELLDVLNEAYIGPGMDFLSLHTERNKPGFQRFGYRLPLWMEIKDVDGDGNPEIKLLIYIYDKYDFDLYIQCSRLR